MVKTALYFYAEEGKKPEEFDDIDFTNLSDDDGRSAGAGGRRTTPGGFH